MKEIQFSLKDLINFVNSSDIKEYNFNKTTKYGKECKACLLSEYGYYRYPGSRTMAGWSIITVELPLTDFFCDRFISMVGEDIIDHKISQLCSLRDKVKRNLTKKEVLSILES